MRNLPVATEIAENRAIIAAREHRVADLIRQAQEGVDQLNDMKAELRLLEDYLADHPDPVQCSREECERPVKAQGLCRAHYDAARKEAGK